jgi:hypothetical protein
VISGGISTYGGAAYKIKIWKSNQQLHGHQVRGGGPKDKRLT